MILFVVVDSGKCNCLDNARSGGLAYNKFTNLSGVTKRCDVECAHSSYMPRQGLPDIFNAQTTTSTRAKTSVCVPAVVVGSAWETAIPRREAAVEINKSASKSRLFDTGLVDGDSRTVLITKPREATRYKRHQISAPVM